MTDYYVDPSATGADDGTSWTDAWTTLQRAIDGTGGTQPVAADVVYCRGTETLSAAVDIDGNSGTTSTGLIRFIGTNGSGVVDGTRYILDANSAAANCFATTSAAYISWENFDIKNATSYGIDSSSGGDYWLFNNCVIQSNGSHGVYNTNSARYWTFIRSIIQNNTGDGVNALGPVTKFIFSVFTGNGESGFDAGYSDDMVFFGCIFHDNGNSTDQLGIDAGCFVANCVFDGTDQTGATGLLSNNFFNVIILNRFTNIATGINATGDVDFYGWNYFHNNTADTANATYLYPIYIDGTDTNKSDVDADDGYTNVTNNDFNLKSSRTYNGDGNDTIGLQIGT